MWLSTIQPDFFEEEDKVTYIIYLVYTIVYAYNANVRITYIIENMLNTWTTDQPSYDCGILGLNIMTTIYYSRYT